jgi:hypothetical protein
MNLVKGEAKRTSDFRTRCFRGGKSLYQVHWGVQVVSPLRTLPEITAAFRDEGEKTGAVMVLSGLPSSFDNGFIPERAP